MGKVIVFNLSKNEGITIEKEFKRENNTVKDILSFLKISKATVFINNIKSKSLKQTLTKNDILFIFKT